MESPGAVESRVLAENQAVVVVANPEVIPAEESLGADHPGAAVNRAAETSRGAENREAVSQPGAGRPGANLVRAKPAVQAPAA